MAGSGQLAPQEAKYICPKEAMPKHILLSPLFKITAMLDALLSAFWLEEGNNSKIHAPDLLDFMALPSLQTMLLMMCQAQLPSSCCFCLGEVQRQN